MRRLRVVERALVAAGLVLLAVYVAVRGYGEAMRRSEIRRFDAARAAHDAAGIATAGKAGAAAADQSREGEPHAASPMPAEPAFRVPSAVDTHLWSPQRIRAYQESLRGDVGAPLAILRIPRIRLEVPVLDGTDEPRLNRGVGRIEGTALPGQTGNLGIAGHRDGFFRGLKDLKVGDTVELETLDGTGTYTVDGIRIVSPTDVGVLRPTASNVITMVTCYPFYFVGSAPRRYIVRARRAGGP